MLIMILFAHMEGSGTDWGEKVEPEGDKEKRDKRDGTLFSIFLPEPVLQAEGLHLQTWQKF